VLGASRGYYGLVGGPTELSNDESNFWGGVKIILPIIFGKRSCILQSRIGVGNYSLQLSSILGRRFMQMGSVSPNFFPIFFAFVTLDLHRVIFCIFWVPLCLDCSVLLPNYKWYKMLLFIFAYL
jgi:hypothetical protein